MCNVMYVYVVVEDAGEGDAGEAAHDGGLCIIVVCSV